MICRAFYYIHRVCDCKRSCAGKTAVFPHGDSAHHPHAKPIPGERGAVPCAGRGRRPLTGSRVREPSGEDRGVQPLRIVPARARRRAGQQWVPPGTRRRVSGSEARSDPNRGTPIEGWRRSAARQAALWGRHQGRAAAWEKAAKPEGSAAARLPEQVDERV